jgi:nephrocystin-3
MSAGGSRTVRVFLSSTFRDFGEERDLLVRQVFPALRARLKERFVELVDVDLRWGITAEQAERGEVLPICLTEIDRSRPYFIGMLGERYGWVPPPGTLAPQLLARQPWLAQHAGGTSVTELEILHGVLNNPALAGRAFFYFRSRAYARTKAGDYLPASRDDRARQVQLKRRIQRSGFPVVRYDRPETLAARIERDLWQLLDVQFPAGEVPTAAERAMRQHEAYAAPRRRLYLGTQDLLNAMDQALAQGESRILIEGASGGGKSALLANWAHRHAQAHPADQVLTHYLAASSDSADPEALVRRLLEFLRDTMGSTEEIPQAAEALFDSVGSWLAQASTWAQAQGARWVFLIDGLNGLRSGRDLRWFPTFVPPQVHLMVSCLPGKVRTALDRKGPWHAVQVRPLEGAQRRELLVNYLATFNKTLADDLIPRAGAPAGGQPLVPAHAGRGTAPVWCLRGAGAAPGPLPGQRQCRSAVRAGAGAGRGRFRGGGRQRGDARTMGQPRGPARGGTSKRSTRGPGSAGAGHLGPAASCPGRFADRGYGTHRLRPRLRAPGGGPALPVGGGGADRDAPCVGAVVCPGSATGASRLRAALSIARGPGLARAASVPD